MLSPEILKEIRGLELRAGHLVTDALAGDYVSAFKGRGMEFDEVREYVPGDDVRAIDWNVTARMRAPFVKVFREEREQTLMLMVDVSPSQAFGTGARLKREQAAELAAILAFLAIRSNDKVGLVVFSDHVEQYFPPKKGRAHVFRIIREVLTHRGEGRRTDIAGALDFVVNVHSRRTTCFLISDFWAADFETSLKLAARRHDLVAVRTLDPREAKLVPAGFVTFVDSETGAEAVVDTSDRRVRAAYEAAVKDRDERLSTLLKRTGISGFRLETGGSVTAPLIAYLRDRERRRRG